MPTQGTETAHYKEIGWKLGFKKENSWHVQDIMLEHNRAKKQTWKPMGTAKKAPGYLF